MELPKEFLHLKNRQKRIVLHLLKCLYSLKQAPKLCNDSVNATLTKLNFTRCDADQGSNYSRSTNLHHQKPWTLWNARLQNFQNSFGRQLQERLLLSGKSIDWWWHSTLPEFGWISDVHHDRQKIRYGLVIGELSKYVSKPYKQHLIAAKIILRSLEFIKGFHLKYTVGTPGDTLKLYGYYDASWRCHEEDFFPSLDSFSSSTLDWSVGVPRNKLRLRYLLLRLSTSLAVQEAIWLRNLLAEFGFMQPEPTGIYENNQACIKIALNDMIQPKLSISIFATTSLVGWSRRSIEVGLVPYWADDCWCIYQSAVSREVYYLHSGSSAREHENRPEQECWRWACGYSTRCLHNRCATWRRRAGLGQAWSKQEMLDQSQYSMWSRISRQ